VPLFISTVVAVNPRMTSQKCSDCGIIVKKSLFTRTHKCSCGCELQRDVNAAKNILNLAKATLGHKESNATGVGTSTLVGVNLLEQVLTVNVESPPSPTETLREQCTHKVGSVKFELCAEIHPILA
jgi:putative transposase